MFSKICQKPEAKSIEQLFHLLQILLLIENHAKKTCFSISNAIFLQNDES